jgi:hypothetical protein
MKNLFIAQWPRFFDLQPSYASWRQSGMWPFAVLARAIRGSWRLARFCSASYIRGDAGRYERMLVVDGISCEQGPSSERL